MLKPTKQEFNTGAARIDRLSTLRRKTKSLDFLPLWHKTQTHTYVTTARYSFRVTAFTKSVINAEPTRSFS